MAFRTNGHGRPIVALDLDGTIAEYHIWFLKFAELWTGKSMPAPTDINPGEPLHEFMGISKAQYRECKLAYRQGGMKRSMPCLDNAAGLVRVIRAPADQRVSLDRGLNYTNGLDAEVWICTTRPYLRLDNIDPDTREWLRRNGVQFDAVLFDPLGEDNKYSELIRQAGDRVACALEDLPEQAMLAADCGVPYVFLRDQPYNRHYETPWRWYTADQALKDVRVALTDWRKGHEV